MFQKKKRKLHVESLESFGGRHVRDMILIPAQQLPSLDLSAGIW